MVSGLGRRSRPVVIVLAVAAALVLGVLGLDRLLYEIGGRSYFDTTDQRIGEVLEGRKAGAERSAALAAVTKASESFAPKGTTPVATVQYTICERGQRNFKMRDKYRFFCTAGAASYLAWSGEFEKVAEHARDLLAAKCDLERAHNTPIAPLRPPSPKTMTWNQTYDCESGVTVTLAFATSEGLAASDAIITLAADRVVAGPSSAERIAELSGYDWFLVYRSKAEYYRERA